MQTDSPQSSTLQAVHHGEKRPGVIDSAAYAQRLRVANVEIASTLLVLSLLRSSRSLFLQPVS